MKPLQGVRGRVSRENNVSHYAREEDGHKSDESLKSAQGNFDPSDF